MRLGDLWRRLRHLITRDRVASELDEEMRLHLELRAAKNVTYAMSAEDAALDAKRRFGNRAVLRERGREASGWLFVERLLQDLRYGVHQLARNPTFSATMLVTLALGIGANTAMFSALDALLFAPAHAANPGRLVWVSESQPASGRIRGMSYPDYVTLCNAHTPLAGIVAYRQTHIAIGGGTPERSIGYVVSGNYFNILGVAAALGRTLQPEDDGAPGESAVVVIADTLWRRRFGADPSVINRTIVVNGKPFSIVGVAPAGFAGVEVADEPPGLWVPISMTATAMPGEESLLSEPGSAWLRLVGRMNDAASLSQTNAALQTIELPSRPKPASGPVRLTVALPISGGFDPSNRRQYAPILELIAVIPALVLLIACANAANLMLARGVDRRKELALRRALGASRARIVRQLLTESVMLAGFAGAVGVVFASVLIRVVGAMAAFPPDVLASFVIDGRVLVVTAVAAIATGLVCGIAPALSGSSPALSPALKEDGQTLTASQGRRRLQGSFVTAQVAVSMVLLVMTGLFLRSVAKASHVDPGFDARQGVTASFDLDLQGYTRARQQAFTRALLDRVNAIPGVAAAAVTTSLPLGGQFNGTDVRAESRGDAHSNGPRVSALTAGISDRYFAAMGTPLVEGRAFDEHDTATSTLVVIVSRRLASSLWPGEAAVGKRLRIDSTSESERWREVIGVSRDTKDDGLTEESRAFFYMPIEQQWSGSMSLVARTATDSETLLAPIASTVHELDPDLPVVRARTLESLISEAVETQRGVSSVIGAFGAVALFLASVGLYGVASHSARLRTREVAIRMAIGARAADVYRLLLRQGLGRSLIGIAIGLVLSGIGVAVIASFVFGLAPSDLIVFLGAAAVLAGVAALASYLPARRAASVDPLDALRAE